MDVSIKVPPCLAVTTPDSTRIQLSDPRKESSWSSGEYRDIPIHSKPLFNISS